VRSLPAIVRAVATQGIPGAYRELLPEASRDSVEWIRRQGLKIEGARVLEVGCGRASTAALLQQLGANVAAFDLGLPAVQHAQRDGLRVFLGDANALPCKNASLDLVVSINVVCHLRRPRSFFDEALRCLRPGGYAFVTWTNWYSPMGGHDFSPYHYLGPRLGYRLACRLKHKERFIQVPYDTLWPNHIGPTLETMRRSGFQLLDVRPRYYPGLAFVCRVPVLREFLTWNCQVLMQKPGRG
jgi:SAM-dependent methyltransferase